MKRVVAFLLALGILVSSIYVPDKPVYAETALDRAKIRKAEIEQQLQASKQKLQEYTKNMQSAGTAEEKLAAAAKVEQAEKEVLTAQLLELYAEGEAIEAALEDAEADYLQKEADFYEKSRMMYVYSCQSPLEVLAASESISDFIKRIKLILFVSEEDNKQIQELEDAKKEYEYKKQYQEENAEILKGMVEAKELSLNNLQLSKSDLQSRISKAQALLAEAVKQEQELQEDLRAIQSEIAKLEDAQRKALEEEKRKNQESGKGNGSSGNKYTGGKFLWPVPSSSRLSSYYGSRIDPITGVKGAFHTGLDIPAPKGSAILAAADGTVIMATVNGGFGKCVKISHGSGVVTLYGHCNELLVTAGQQVKKGDLIARVGTTGRSTGNHLHFEVQINGKHTDPMPYLRG